MKGLTLKSVMDILLAAATAKEIEPFFNYYRHTKRKQNIDILITGIGLTSATYHLLKQIQLKRPGAVIQAGIAGGFDKKFTPGSVLVVKKDTIADLGVTESAGFKTVFHLGLAIPDQFPFKNGWLINDSELIKKSGLKKVTAVSVNEITTDADKLKQYKTIFKPAIESMEGAALHYVCLMEKIPFLQLRAVSNLIGERDKKKWQMRKAITNLNKELISLIESL